jgi:hypothetical protein
LNYRAALYEAIRLLDELPLSQRLIRETHKVLIQGVRGHNRSPGEYRVTREPPRKLAAWRAVADLSDLAHLSRGVAVVSKCTQDLDDMVTATKLARQFGRQAFGENPAKGVLCWIEAARRDPTAPRDFYW